MCPVCWFWPQSELELNGSDHEVAVCAMASYFLGSDGAPTTAEVLEERLATFGHAEETAALMGDDHETTVAPHPDGAHGVATRAPTHVAILHDEL